MLIGLNKAGDIVLHIFCHVENKKTLNFSIALKILFSSRGLFEIG